jgi:glucosamine--fructose-6-phosphate aminotransferase (isomerizing)
MCGIVGGVTERDITPILMEGLRRLEYRGYDSAGIAVLDGDQRICRVRTLGKVRELEAAVRGSCLHGTLGIAHTRWATHGEPSEANAHPHVCRDQVALVHNGIIENHQALRRAQREGGHRFTSDTDTEVIVHAVYDRLQAGDALLEAVAASARQLEGAYALGVIRVEDGGRLVATRQGSPLVIGLGIGENFIASDVFALLPVTQRFIFLEEGDIAELTRERVRIFDASGAPVERPVKESGLTAESAERGGFRHFMLKEIHEQPRAIADTLEGRIGADHVLPAAFGPEAEALFAATRAVQIVACGTSYHAAMVARYWMEGLAGIPCNVEVASEFRYRRQLVADDALFVTISQSGETADTLAALRLARELGYRGTLAVCNVPESSLVRESDLVLLTHAGPEIGVASTKAFTTQLVALLLLVAALGRCRGTHPDVEARIVAALRALPGECERILELDGIIRDLAERFGDKRHALFLGRGEHYPIAMEGALKLKEISYIHAEAYPAGELKHGPLALVDAEMPVIAVAPNNRLLEKLKSNLEEVRARGGELIVFAADSVALEPDPRVTTLHFPVGDAIADPVVFTIPLQLLAYHVAVLKGTDVDQPRNLAKSVTVE